MEKAILYIHGKGGSCAEAEQFRKNCPGFAMIGVDYDGQAPWTARAQIRAAYEAARREHGRLTVIANSIGAYFAMLALQGCGIEKALFISPVLDMERLILDMLRWAQVTERDLQERGEIPTEFGETLSWEYLRFVREHPPAWEVPTEILCAEGDALIPRETVDAFLESHAAALTVMDHGEHWFHTGEQLAFLDAWMRRVL